MDAEKSNEEILDGLQGISSRGLDGGSEGKGRPEGERRNAKTRPALIYTTSRWQAIAHISGGKTAIEARYPDPWTLFPIRIMKQVDYGIANGGLECFVVEYDAADKTPLGVIMYLRAGRLDVACYAIRYDMKTRSKLALKGGPGGTVREGEDTGDKQLCSVH